MTSHHIARILVIALLVAPAAFAQDAGLFNGKDLSGWTCKPEDKQSTHWKVEDGMIVGENADKKGSVLWTDAKHVDYELELEYKTPSKDYDSGVFARGSSHQIQIGVSRSLKKDLTGCIYAPKDKQGKYPAVSDKVKEVHKLGEWNKLKIIVKGKNIKVFLNDQAFVDYDCKTIPGDGPIGLQLHGGVHMKMFFRNFKYKKLG